MTDSPAMNALRQAGYCPDHIHNAQGEDCPECEIKGLRLLLAEYRVRAAELENSNVEQGAIPEAVMGALKGEEPSDFMRSFPDVEHAWWIYRLAYPTAK